jgi:hypothetical protein
MDQNKRLIIIKYLNKKYILFKKIIDILIDNYNKMIF